MKALLPVPVKDHPHWRVRFKPLVEHESVIRPLELQEIARQCTVRLRGWAYPYCGRRDAEWDMNSQFVASWVSWEHEIEYWRLYTSRQFIHLFAVREEADPSYAQEIASYIKHLRRFCVGEDGAAALQNGIHIFNALYYTSEIFEFAARLSGKGFYSTSFEVDISIVGIKGYALVTEPMRSLHGIYTSPTSDVRHVITCAPSEAVSNSRGFALDAAIDLFRQFRWSNPSIDVLRQEQINMFEQARRF